MCLLQVGRRVVLDIFNFHFFIGLCLRIWRGSKRKTQNNILKNELIQGNLLPVYG